MRRLGVGLLAAGIILIALYFGLKAGNVANVGAPTDIGGGLILLAGYIAEGAGILLLLIGRFLR